MARPKVSPEEWEDWWASPVAQVFRAILARQEQDNLDQWLERSWGLGVLPETAQAELSYHKARAEIASELRSLTYETFMTRLKEMESDEQ